jgi:hypothetical protein
MTHWASNTRLATILIATVALTMALAAGAASARPYEEFYVNPSTGYPSSLPWEGKQIYVNPSTGFASGAEATESSPDPTGAASTPQVALDHPASAGGFDWPSAGIGAAAGAAFLMIVLAATTAITGRGRGPLARRGAVRT